MNIQENKKCVAVIQMRSTLNKSNNLAQSKMLIEKAKNNNVKMVFLPECFDVMAEKRGDTYDQSESLDGATITAYRTIATDLDLWISLGGFHQTDGATKIKNTHVIIDNEGAIRATYDKLHLFDAVGLKESDSTNRGREVTSPVETAVGKIGLQICYDLRFPELSVAQTLAGAQILTFPSAFTKATGEAHWHTLLKSRAIENQCYVIAAAQVGQHNAKRSSYGHALVVDPWGEIIAECNGEDEAVCYATIDLDLVDKVRARIPVQQHRRTDISGLVPRSTSVSQQDQHTPQAQTDIDLQQHYEFSSRIRIPSSQLFHRTALSFAFVNIKPVLEGHVLISPLRVVKHLADLDPAEVADLFQTVQAVSEVIKQHYGATSITVTVQDGKEAGQSVEHVHVHVMPRKAGDFKRNDDIYDKLETHDKDMNAADVRSEQSMQREALALRDYFKR